MVDTIETLLNESFHRTMKLLKRINVILLFCN